MTEHYSDITHSVRCAAPESLQGGLGWEAHAAKANRPAEPRSNRPTIAFSGAGDGIRTHDIQHGKLALYQLSYTREGAGT